DLARLTTFEPRLSAVGPTVPQGKPQRRQRSLPASLCAGRRKTLWFPARGPPLGEPPSFRLRALPRREARSHGVAWAVLPVIAGGGVVGALARCSVYLLLLHRIVRCPWLAFPVNISGCLAMLS